MLVDGGIPLSASAPMPSVSYQAKQIHRGPMPLSSIWFLERALAKLVSGELLFTPSSLMTHFSCRGCPSSPCAWLACR